MNRILAMLLLSILPLAAHAQTLGELKQQYKGDSPLKLGSIKSTQLVDPEVQYTTEEEERLAALKAQELAEKQALDEKVYLDTDFKFFQSLAVPLQEKEDELDKAYKKNLVEKDLEQARVTDTTVKTEIKTTTPVPMSRAEGVASDTRRQVLMKNIADNARTIKACVVENNKKGIAFTGTEMTLVWDVSLAGKVEDAKVESTDVKSQEIQSCVLKSLAAWDFADAMKSSGKKSRVQYTFRFTKEPKAVASQN